MDPHNLPQNIQEQQSGLLVLEAMTPSLNAVNNNPSSQGNIEDACLRRLHSTSEDSLVLTTSFQLNTRGSAYAFRNLCLQNHALLYVIEKGRTQINDRKSAKYPHSNARTVPSDTAKVTQFIGRQEYHLSKESVFKPLAFYPLLSLVILPMRKNCSACN